MSTSRDEAQSSFYSPFHAHGDSSSRAITSNLGPAPGTSASRASSHTPNTPQQPASRGVGLGEHFNEPLRLHVWTSKRRWTHAELEREREEFFETRVTGRQEIWCTLKMVVGLMMGGDLETAQGIIDAAGVTLPRGDLISGAYDEMGNFYQMPELVISDPANVISGSHEGVIEDAKTERGEEIDEEELERRREEKGKGVLKTGDTIKIKARLSDRGGPDVQILLGKDQNVRVLARKVQEEAGIVGKGKVKIAYLGKVLKDGEPLPSQGWREGHVVNALVFP
ncbi:MAG: hypothetical protein M1830_008924 [Pleopsidium flavum]|nr:MAG: hypothetical protein M1830_008924 [Pleopsidium flavum]